MNEQGELALTKAGADHGPEFMQAAMADWDHFEEVVVVGADEHLAAVEDGLRQLFDETLQRATSADGADEAT